jgi:predicted metalloprotease with PDZ domain
MSWYRAAVLASALLVHADLAWAQTIAYRVAIPAPEEGWMQVDIVLRDAPAGPVDLHMSRSSPGRYAIHEFARGVRNVTADDGTGAAVPIVQIAPSRWRVEQHGPTVRVRYRIAGTITDGTYLGIDAGHAHINMPAALMRVRGAEQLPLTVEFEPPAGRDWRIATQLFPGPDGFSFRAPNLQYLMDSPAELSAMTVRTFSVAGLGPPAEVRVAVHHLGTDADVDALAADAERIVRETASVFGELPAFDNGTYTFIADYLPSVVPDAMEHRNSTVLTSRGSILNNRENLLESMSHEFFHAWNVERIRPASLEPFNFDESNPSSELWFAEGVTEYYSGLILARAGLKTVGRFASDIGGMVGDVLASPARAARTLEDMSRLAVVVDGAETADVAGVRSSFLSYYTWGGVVGLALDLTLREKTDGRVTLDHVLKAMWERHGRPGGREAGYVDQPYTTADLKTVLTALSGDAAFVDEFFAQYIQGHQVTDYDRLLGLAGFVWSGGARGRALVSAETLGTPLTPAQQRFRDAWLGASATRDRTASRAVTSGPVIDARTR